MEEKNLYIKFIFLSIFLLSFIMINNKPNLKDFPKEENPIVEIDATEEENKEELGEQESDIHHLETKDILISAVGDCTIGDDDKLGYSGSFTQELKDQKGDFAYFFSGVKDILEKDDLTIANLEGPFTESIERVEKKFNFKGALNYPEILIKGSIEAVNLANNHAKDYGEDGYKDTKKALENYKMPYFGFGDYHIYETKGIKIGLAGFVGWDESVAKTNTKKAIDYFHKNNTDLIILSYHWGDEQVYQPTPKQNNIGHYAIDAGADLVIGHHPHVLQEIEKYKNKYIVYSLGNFVFGGNRNPSDKDTVIFQQLFHYEDGVLTKTAINAIPCYLSSTQKRNDYRPIIADEKGQARIYKKLKMSK